MPPERYGRYVVEAEIGDGAMGRVYRARDPLAQRVVAIKTIKSELLTKENAPEYLRRFHREAQAAGGLSHPNLVTVFDIGEGYFVMEYLEGTTLQALVRQQGHLELPQALKILGPVAEALDYAHRCGIVHRDIKPGNIMVLPDGRPKIMDFGVAHLASTVMTTAGQMLGSPSYMAPEQIAGEDATPRADLFSLAAVTYEMLTGRRAFEGTTVTTIIFKVMNVAPDPPRRWNGDLPAHYDDVFARALAKSPAERYDSARAFAAALDLKGLDYAMTEALVTGPAEGPAPPAPTRAKAPVAPATSVPAVLEVPAAELAPVSAPVPSARASLSGGETVDLRGDAKPVAAVEVSATAAKVPAIAPEAPSPATPPEAAPAAAPAPEPAVAAATAPAPEPPTAAAPARGTPVMTEGEALMPRPARRRGPWVVAALVVAVGVPLWIVFGRAKTPSPTPSPSDGQAVPATITESTPTPVPAATPSVEPTSSETPLTAASPSAPAVSPTASPKPAATPRKATPRSPAVREGDLVELTADVVPPRKLSGKSPDYTRAAARAKLQGSVTVAMIVTETGEPVNLTVIESPGPALSESVIAALQTWRFQPATKSGVKVRVPWRQTFSFVVQ